MVVYVGAIHIDPDLMKAGSFLAFNIAFANLMAAVLAVGYTSIGLLELIPRYERIKPILVEQPEFAAAVDRAGSPHGRTCAQPRFVSLSRPGERGEGSRQRESSGAPGRIRGDRRPIRLRQIDIDASLARIRDSRCGLCHL